jgi:hypothetical protein
VAFCEIDTDGPTPPPSFPRYKAQTHCVTDPHVTLCTASSVLTFSNTLEAIFFAAQRIGARFLVATKNQRSNSFLPNQ